MHREEIVEALWVGTPPPTAVSLVQAYVSRLRRVLAPGQSRQVRAARLASSGASYRLEATPGELDLIAFRQLTHRGAAAGAGGDAASACDLYDRALRLWRGEPLADVDVLRGNGAVTAVAAQRGAAVLGYAAIAADRGWHDRVLPWLRALAQSEPFNEKAHAYLMIALAGFGEQAAALGIYEDLRRRLDDQLGVLPSQELTDTLRRVLRQDIPAAAATTGDIQAADDTVTLHAAGPDELRAAPHQTPAAGPAPAVPAPRSPGPGHARPAPARQLPAAVAHFVGRDGQLAALTGLLRQAREENTGAPVISAIDGTAGVGKTALAVHWAHQVAGEFPDGQLYVNLRGYDPDQPRSAADALAGFLRALGVAGQDIPAGADERVDCYRSLLAGKRILVVLDNARSAAQIRPLLPGTRGCMAVVTSRDSLAGLVARDGAARLDLDVLPPAEAVSLLRELIGDRVDASPEAAAALAAMCSRLPLALRVAAELAVTRGGAPLEDLVGELADHQRLNLLDAGGDPSTAIRDVFSWSYRHLGADTARAFRLLSLHPGADLCHYAAAALIGGTVPQAEREVGALARAHLVYRAGPHRYGMHDLLRGYACELACTLDTEDDRSTALTRLFDYYLHTAAVAMDVLYPGERHRRPRIPAPPGPEPRLAGAAAARAWLDAERGSLVAAAAHAAGHGWPDHAIRLAFTVFRYLEVTGHYPEIVAIHGDARRAARLVGDRLAEAEALQALSVVDLRLGRYQQAGDRLRQALRPLREAGSHGGQARALGNLGMACVYQGRYAEAVRRGEQALTLYRRAGDRFGEARGLNNLGFVNMILGRYPQAVDYLRQAEALSREIGDQAITAYALINLGMIDLREGQGQQAAAHLREALTLSQETGNRTCEAHSLANLGLADLLQCRFQQAVGQLRQALALSRELGDRAAEAETLNGLGQALLATGQAARALAQHRAALGLAIRIGDRYQQARAERGLGEGYHASGDAAQAGYHWGQALALYADLGTPEAGQVRVRLEATEHG